MNELFPFSELLRLNGIFILLLGLFVFSKRRNVLTSLFFVANIFLAVFTAGWSFGDAFTLPRVNLVSQVTMFAMLVFLNGYYYISRLYPNPGKRIDFRLNFLVFIAFAVLIFFTEFVTKAELIDNNVVFSDGLGYILYSIYFCILAFAAIYHLTKSYIEDKNKKTGIFVLSIGMWLFFIPIVLFDLVLPIFGNYEWLNVAHLFTVFPPIFVAYALTKHGFLDISVVIEKSASKIISALIMILIFYVAVDTTRDNFYLTLLTVIVLALFWSEYSLPLQHFLITTAKRKFVRGWYNAEDVLTRISDKLKQEDNKENILKIVAKELDNTFQFETIYIVVAVRGREEKLLHYAIITHDDLHYRKILPLESEFINDLSHQMEITSLSQCDGESQEYFRKLGFKNLSKCLLLPFSSPEAREGLIVLGERSNQASLTKRDMDFLGRLETYISAILCRLTPYEKLEKIYFENKEKLHDAEIQLIRAEKLQSIAHATRQAHHEIRTPLSIISLGARQIVDMESAEKYKKISIEQVERAVELINQTMKLTDMESHLRNRFDAVNVNELIQKSLHLLPESSHRKLLELDSGLPMIYAVSADIQILITNLMKNAIEAMQEKGTLRISSSCDERGIVVTVSDTGVGITPEVREKVWEPYFSGKVTAGGNATAGRGWGLTIVNRIITDHKGTIKFDSTPGKGTTFTVSIPIGDKSLLSLVS